MITQEQIAEAMLQMIPNPSLATDGGVDEQARRLLAELNYDPDGVYSVGNTIVMLALQSNEQPERTVVGAWVTGVIVGSMLARKGATDGA